MTQPAHDPEPRDPEPREPEQVDHLSEIRALLDAEEWTYQVDDERPVISAGFTGNSGEWRVFLVATEDGVVIVDSVLSQLIPEERRVEVAHLLTLANFGMRVGGFQFDFSDGEVRFHSGIDLEGTHLTELMFKNLLFTNLATMDRHFHAIMSVTYGNVAGLSAYEELQNEIL